MLACEDNVILPAGKRSCLISFKFRKYDFWIGFYWDATKRTLYFRPLPCCVFEIAIRCIRHDWVMEGGSACPAGLGRSVAHFQCAKCDTHDYGEKGGPSWNICDGCPEKENDHDQGEN